MMGWLNAKTTFTTVAWLCSAKLSSMFGLLLKRFLFLVSGLNVMCFCLK